MFSVFKSPFAARRDHAACSGCSLCLLVCPVWRQSRDVSLTPLGRVKALQHGAGAAEVAASVEHCTAVHGLRTGMPGKNRHHRHHP